jgi:hypothetical protein
MSSKKQDQQNKKDPEAWKKSWKPGYVYKAKDYVEGSHRWRKAT